MYQAQCNVMRNISCSSVFLALKIFFSTATVQSAPYPRTSRDSISFYLSDRCRKPLLGYVKCWLKNQPRTRYYLLDVYYMWSWIFHLTQLSTTLLWHTSKCTRTSSFTWLFCQGTQRKFFKKASFSVSFFIGYKSHY